MIERDVCVRCFLAMIVVAGVATQATAQDNSLVNRRPRGANLTMAEANIFRAAPFEPPTLKLHDKVSVRVDELARTQADGEMQQRKNSTFNAAILDWFRFNGFRKAEPTQASGQDPRIQGELQQLFRGESELETVERLTFNIAAEVVDTRANGHLVLEASKNIQINEEVWLITLSGQCRQEDVGADNTVLSRDVLNLKITKKEMGHVRDGYKRGWMHRALDQINPF